MRFQFIHNVNKFINNSIIIKLITIFFYHRVVKNFNVFLPLALCFLLRQFTQKIVKFFFGHITPLICNNKLVLILYLIMYEKSIKSVFIVHYLYNVLVCFFFSYLFTN